MVGRAAGGVKVVAAALNGSALMSLPEGLHVERTEFLGTDQSKAGQELLLQYLSDTESTGELPLYRPDTYAHALASGRVPASARPTGR
jgi:hypothetical protein